MVENTLSYLQKMMCMKIFFYFTQDILIAKPALIERTFTVIEELGDQILGSQKCPIKNPIPLIREADVVILEGTVPAIDTGFYVQMCLELDKPVILLHHESVNLNLLKGISNERLQVIQYTEGFFSKTLNEALNYAKDFVDIRFNFFISHELNSYLNWAAKKSYMLKSNFIRNLILQHMKLHQNEYKSQ